MGYKTSFKGNVPLSKSEFRKILQFYLFECPVPNVSCRGKTFKELGWKGSGSFSKLKKKMLSVENSDIKENYYPCKKEDLIDAIAIVQKITPPHEYCVFLKSDEKTIMQSLFRGIRNAFAHGSFNVHSYNKQRIYYFENYDKYLKAKMAIKEGTLLKWIEYLYNSESN